MANQHLIYQSHVELHQIAGCSCVTLCLTDECSAYTIDGKGLVKASLDSMPRRMVYYPHGYINLRRMPVMQYSFSLDDTQLKVDPATSKPYVIDCCCIREIIPYTCTIDKLK